MKIQTALFNRQSSPNRAPAAKQEECSPYDDGDRYDPNPSRLHGAWRGFEDGFGLGVILDCCSFGLAGYVGNLLGGVPGTFAGLLAAPVAIGLGTAIHGALNPHDPLIQP